MTTLQKIAVGVVAILAVIGSIGFVRTLGSSSTFGATTFQQGQVQNNPMIFVNGFSAGSSQQFGVDSSGNLNAGTLSITGAFTQATSNTATSTASVGCVQTVATSTATPIRLLFTASTTATAISGTQSGFVLWGYGKCPF
jgi:hypothetical protein